MLRWTDLIGLAGFAVIVLSTFFLFPGSAEHTNWHYMLGGLALWVAGFASIVECLLLRFSRDGKAHPNK